MIVSTFESSVVKILPANAGATGEVGSIPDGGRAPGGGNGNPLQYSFLGNPMDRGASQATVLGVAKSQTQLSIYTSERYLRDAVSSHAKSMRY